MTASARASRSRASLAEVCREVGIQPYVLRYWETEFPALVRSREGAGRGYGADEVELVRRIKTLLYDEGYTIAGARKKIETEGVAPPAKKDVGAEDPQPAGGASAVAAASIDTPGATGLNDLKPRLEAVLDELEGILSDLE